MMDSRAFLENYQAIDFEKDPLPIKVLRNAIIKTEIPGQAVHWAFEYLDQRSCPLSLISHILTKLDREVRKNDFSHCAEKTGSDDAIDGNGSPEDTRYEPLKLMRAIINIIDEVCLKEVEDARDSVDGVVESPDMQPHIFGVSYGNIKNTRRFMEDRMTVLPRLDRMFNLLEPTSYFAVFDGHNGAEAAAYGAAQMHQYLIQNMSGKQSTDVMSSIIEAVEQLDSAFIEKCRNGKVKSGSTVVLSLVMPQKLYVAWVGDSQAVLVKRNEVHNLVTPHKPDRVDEVERIRSQGGEVFPMNGTYRVNGNLAVSRAIGDADDKTFIISTPDIKMMELDGTEECLILACDGLWDEISPQQAAHIVRRQVVADATNVSLVSQKLIQQAKQNGSTDNISVIVVFLEPMESIRNRYEGLLEDEPEVVLLKQTTEPVIENLNNMASTVGIEQNGHRKDSDQLVDFLSFGSSKESGAPFIGDDGGNPSGDEDMDKKIEVEELSDESDEEWQFEKPNNEVGHEPQVIRGNGFADNPFGSGNIPVDPLVNVDQVLNQPEETIALIKEQSTENTAESFNPFSNENRGLYEDRTNADQNIVGSEVTSQSVTNDLGKEFEGFEAVSNDQNVHGEIENNAIPNIANHAEVFEGQGQIAVVPSQGFDMFGTTQDNIVLLTTEPAMEGQLSENTRDSFNPFSGENRELYEERVNAAVEQNVVGGEVTSQPVQLSANDLGKEFEGFETVSNDQNVQPAIENNAAQNVANTTDLFEGDGQIAVVSKEQHTENTAESFNPFSSENRELYEEHTNASVHQNVDSEVTSQAVQLNANDLGKQFEGFEAVTSEQNLHGKIENNATQNVTNTTDLFGVEGQIEQLTENIAESFNPFSSENRELYEERTSAAVEQNVVSEVTKQAVQISANDLGKEFEGFEAVSSDQNVHGEIENNATQNVANTTDLLEGDGQIAVVPSQGFDTFGTTQDNINIPETTETVKGEIDMVPSLEVDKIETAQTDVKEPTTKSTPSTAAVPKKSPSKPESPQKTTKLNGKTTTAAKPTAARTSATATAKTAAPKVAGAVPAAGTKPATSRLGPGATRTVAPKATKDVKAVEPKTTAKTTTTTTARPKPPTSTVPKAASPSKPAGVTNISPKRVPITATTTRPTTASRPSTSPRTSNSAKTGTEATGTVPKPRPKTTTTSREAPGTGGPEPRRLPTSRPGVPSTAAAPKPAPRPTGTAGTVGSVPKPRPKTAAPTTGRIAPGTAPPESKRLPASRPGAPTTATAPKAAPRPPISRAAPSSARTAAPAKSATSTAATVPKPMASRIAAKPGTATTTTRPTTAPRTNTTGKVPTSSAPKKIESTLKNKKPAPVSSTLNIPKAIKKPVVESAELIELNGVGEKDTDVSPKEEKLNENVVNGMNGDLDETEKQDAVKPNGFHDEQQSDSAAPIVDLLA